MSTTALHTIPRKTPLERLKKWCRILWQQRAPVVLCLLPLAVVEEENILLAFRNTTGFIRLRPLHDASDFCLNDEKGENRIQSVAAQENVLSLKPGRPVAGKACISYGAHLQGPEGAIVDQRTYLPIISFIFMKAPVRCIIRKG